LANWHRPGKMKLLAVSRLAGVIFFSLLVSSAGYGYLVAEFHQLKHLDEGGIMAGSGLTHRSLLASALIVALLGTGWAQTEKTATEVPKPDVTGEWTGTWGPYQPEQTPKS